jgi:hypothetical protein
MNALKILHNRNSSLGRRILTAVDSTTHYIKTDQKLTVDTIAGTTTIYLPKKDDAGCLEFIVKKTTANDATIKDVDNGNTVATLNSGSTGTATFIVATTAWTQI